ncbi:MAG: PQQ-dependent sugar dehydrogenase [Bacteroidetes bacterium]|jgi:glucose/arabinose dehydrogenase|nr:PQQ-dependent sugar dehydrogenase [Bacteroidota bacterium]
MQSVWKILSLLLLLLILYGMSCMDLNKSNHSQISGISQPSTPEEKHYQYYCAGCHGVNLNEFVNKDWMFANNPEEIAQIIKQGEDEMGMPAFGKALSDKEINRLTDYILSKSKQLAEAPESDASDQSNQIYDEPEFWVETMVTGLEIPWGLEFLPNGDMLIAERNGTLSRYTSDGKLIQISGLPPVRDRGQGGLMDLQLHPDYSENGWLYISYSYFDDENSGNSNTAIIRARLDSDQLTHIETLYRGKPALSTSHHFGSRIEFDTAGYMYFAIGDRGRRDEFPQSINNSNGKIHRLFDDGRIPPDNPFVGRKGAEESIYSYGHRNPQGLALHPVTKEMWSHEHGPRGGDEINIIQKGENYGWPVISYGINYNGTVFTDDTAKPGMLQPVLYYDPSIAPCGMAFVNSDRYEGWKNNLLIGSLSFQYLERVVIENNEVVHQEKLLDGIGRVRNVRVGPDGYIYVAVEEPGRILRLVPVEE